MSNIDFWGRTEKDIREISINKTRSEGKDMEKIKNDDFIGKKVINTKGFIIGVVQRSVRDTTSGEIISILVKPTKETDVQKYILTDGGEIIFPFSAISSVKDIVIFEEQEI
jgi:sporulation protein YlmC with PRC-barrel domain